MSRVSRLCFAVVLALMLFVGCGSEESTDEVAPKKDDSGVTTIDITFEGDTVEPQGAKLEVVAGEPVKLRIDADQGGELHVHSSPEQELEYSAGFAQKISSPQARTARRAASACLSCRRNTFSSPSSSSSILSATRRP